MGKTQPGASEGAPASKSLLFMMIAISTGFCVLLGAGLVTASRLIRSLELRQGSDKSTVRTPLGEFRMDKTSQGGPGLPVYPQASLVLPGAASPPLGTNDHPQVVSSMYHTNTTRDFVATWYREHLSPEFARQDPGPKSLPPSFAGSPIADDDIVFLGERGDQVRVVSLSADNTGTKITLLRSANPAAR
jgi:hypothetical protein